MLVAVPLAVFVVPALFGHPAVAGDNAIQNLPLRVLVGRDLAHGQLPLWDPYLWSGTPLLGGLNAGAAYPLTLAFAVLPPVAAWTAGMVAVYWAAGLGMYALVRQLGARPLAALLAALTYAWSGAMAGQMVHLGVVQGMAWVPWLLLAVVRLAGAVLQGRGSPWPWVALLAATVGLAVLTGEPRAMVEVEVVGTLAVLWLVVRPYADRPGAGRRLLLAGLSLLGAAWGAAIGAVQAVVGWGFIDASQRASESYQFFGTGSLRPAWTALLLVPDLFGGDGVLHQPTYFMSYNLAEVTGYVGLVPLVAVAGLLVGRRGREWVPWLALAAIGLVLAWGSFTPLGHLLVHVPLLGRTRLQSRNLGITDLALAVLLGLWAERALGTHPEEAGLAPRRRWVAAAPALAAAALCAVALAVPAALEGAFGAVPSAVGLGRYLAPWFVAQLVVAAAVVGLVLGWRRLGPAARRRWLTVVVVVDVGLFAASASTGLSNGHVDLEPSRATAVAVLGATGRFAIDDPAQVDNVLDRVGQPDLNVVTGLPSVQGYGSILSGRYGQATGTHTLDRLDPCALADGTFYQLRLASMLVVPTAVAPPAGTPPPATCPGAPARRTAFSLGRVVRVASARLVGAAAAPRLGLLRPGGATTWPSQRATPAPGGAWTVTLAAPVAAVGLVVSTPVAGTSVVDGAGAGRGRWVLDGELQVALGGSSWRYAGSWQGYARYRAARVRPAVWTAGGGSARLVSTTGWGTAVVRAEAPFPVTVVRSEAYLTGWSVRAVPAGGGPARTLPVVRRGLVQAVRVPAGRWTLTFAYHPPGLDAGLAGTAAGLAGMVALAVAWWWRRCHR